MANQTPPKYPLAEVFGYPCSDNSAAANRHRTKRLCPFNNKVPDCTKDKAQHLLGVCSVFHENEVVITCPIRFRQGWLIADDAADFFFPTEATWTTLTEVRLKDADGVSAGNIDIVLCAYVKTGKIYDFGALEVQAVYISGNVRNPFEHYMEAPTKNADMDWTVEENDPRPDDLSSSRKRLAPQLIFKGGIINSPGLPQGAQRASLDGRGSQIGGSFPQIGVVDRTEEVKF
jgi:Restriction endonuclease NotI